LGPWNSFEEDKNHDAEINYILLLNKTIL